MIIKYRKPRIIADEIKAAIAHAINECDGQLIEEIILSKKEINMLTEDLTKDWDNKSNVQCHRIDHDDDPYNGGYNYLTWNGNWGTTYTDEEGKEQYHSIKITEGK